MSESTVTTLDVNAIDLSSMAFITDPYPAYRQLQDQTAIYNPNDTDEYYIFKPAYIEAILKDSHTFSAKRSGNMAKNITPNQQQQIRPLMDSMERWSLFQEPPKHIPLRKILNASLSRKVVTAVEADIQEMACQLVSTMVIEGQNDLVQGVAYPLPALVIARLLGSPVEDIHKVKQWSEDVARYTGSRVEFDEALSIQDNILEMSEYLRELIRQCSEDDEETMMGKLLHFRKQNREFTEEDLIANCIMLLFAGHETTTCLITNLWFQLQKHDDQRQALIEKPELIPDAVEEALRYDGAVQRLGRIIAEDTVLGDVHLKKNGVVYLMLAAANRSAELYDDPDTFNIYRKQLRNNLGFGFGSHLCSGAALARLETVHAVTELLKQIPNAKVIEPPEFHNNLALRSAKSLKIAL